jgi:hypothetical protein
MAWVTTQCRLLVLVRLFSCDTMCLCVRACVRDRMSACAGGPASQSLFTSDATINHHPRFSTLTANIRERRTEKVDMRVPLYHDTATAEYVRACAMMGDLRVCVHRFPAHPDRLPSEVAGTRSAHWPQKSHVYMDSMAFGMGMCCLQVRTDHRVVR